MAPRHFPAGPVLIAASLGMLGLYAWLAQFAFPMADDLAFAATGRTGGFLELQIERWKLWNGRFSSNIPILCSPLVQGLSGLPLYRACPLLLIALTVCAVQGLVRSASDRSISRAHAWAIALVLAMVQFTLMPNLSEGLYWYTGAMTYQTAVITGIVYISMFLSLLHGRPIGHPTLHALVMALVGLAFIGTNEMSMAMAVVAHLAVLFVLPKEHRTTLLFLVLVALAGSALMFFAPGNAGREEQFTGTRLLWHSLAMSGAQSLRFTGLWLLSPINLSGSLLLWTAYETLPEQVKVSARSLYRLRWPLCLMPFALVFIAAYPAYWSTGILGQHRTIDQACGFFVPAWCLVVLVWRSGQRRSDAAPFPAFVKPGASILLALSFILTGNGIKVIDDLASGRASAFAQEMAARFDLMQQASTAASTVVNVPQVMQIPRSLMFMEISDEPFFWVNQAHAQYFGLLEKRIVLDRPGH
ncbi:MAG: hypothetical protein IT229_00580 [Flavobacteriales bacterium]|nr:hypothetical protein [Flavobacteriales bacterium]